MDGLREWVQPRSWEQSHRVVLAIMWAHLGLLLMVKAFYEHAMWWTIPIFLLFAIIGSIPKLHRELRSSSVAVALLTISFVLLHITGGMLEIHLHILLMVALLGVYQLRAPLILAIILIFVHHTNVLAWTNGEHLFVNTHDLPLFLLAFLHVGFAIAVAATSRVRVRAAHLQSQLDEVTKAFSTTANIAKRGQSRADYAERACGEFFSVIVHQLKTPITVMQGYADLLLRSQDKPCDEQETYLKHIVRGTEAMTKMIDVGMQMAQQKMESVDENKVEDIAECIRSIVDEMSIAFEVEYLSAPEIDTSVEVDEYALKIMLQHLVDNAHEHGSGDSVIIEVGEGRRHVEVAVHSWGSVDVSPIDVRSCFAPGYKGKKSNGTGLGLWIVKNYADIMSADVEVSQVEDGTKRKTTFTLCLPKERKVNVNG